MTAQTEAACLLESGALYARRVIVQPTAGDPIFAGFKAGAFSLYFGDAPIFHFDLEGRWQRAFAGGLHYLKGLDGSIQTIDRVREGKNLVLKRRTLAYAEAVDFDARVRSEVLKLLAILGPGRTALVPPPRAAQAISDDELRSFLERIAAWDAAAWFAQRETYLGTYGPLPFLPPDCPQAVTVQATLGHAGGRAFGLGPAHEHYVRSLPEFDEHVRAVVRLLGRRLAQCNAVFLAGSDALLRPEPDVAGYLETIRNVVSTAGSTPAPEGIHAFLDDAPSVGPSRSAWAEYAERGLRRVTLGLESGAREVRALYAKTWRDDDLRRLVADLKAAGIGLGVLTLVGGGGIEHAGPHVDATVALLTSLELSPGDIVSLLDAREVAGAAARSLPFTPVTGAAFTDQLSALRSGLAPLRSARGAKVVPYSLEKQG